jgi:mycofactocin system glycosyltransferase
VTVVVPVHNRSRELSRLLAALGGVSTVVVDDGSDRAAEIEAVTLAAGAHYLPLPQNRGPSAARNAGLMLVRTPFVAFLDSDCVPEKGWLEPLLAQFADPLVGAVAPRVRHAPEGVGGWLDRYESSRSPLDRGREEGLVRPRSRIPFVPSAALVVRREVVGAGCFDESLHGGEDVDLVWRLVGAGWDVRYLPSSIVWHASTRTALPAWLERRAFYGSTAGLLARRHGRELAAVTVPAWMAGVWALTLRRRPVSATVLVSATALVMARRLRTATERPLLAGGWVVADGMARSVVPVLSGAARAWGPAVVAALASRRLRPVAAATLIVPALADWWRDRPPLDPARYLAAHAADDLAYSAGVWAGCVRARTVRPLLPDLVAGIGKRRGNGGGTPARADQAPGLRKKSGGATTSLRSSSWIERLPMPSRVLAIPLRMMSRTFSTPAWPFAPSPQR